MSVGMQLLWLFFIGPVIIAGLIIAYVFIWARIDPCYRMELRTKVINLPPKKRKNRDGLKLTILVIVIGLLLLSHYMHD